MRKRLLGWKVAATSTLSLSLSLASSVGRPWLVLSAAAFLSLRQEDFVIAAELAGASQLRIIFRHMVPSFTSHIIAATTLALSGHDHRRTS